MLVWYMVADTEREETHRLNSLQTRKAGLAQPIVRVPYFYMVLITNLISWKLSSTHRV